MKNDRILLFFLPFWTPYIPPQGITVLKRYLQEHGYFVRTDDPNMNLYFRELYNEYFKLLKQIIPYEKRGNFVNVGHDVLLNHMMAHIHYTDRERYIELVKIIVYKTFYTEITYKSTIELNNILDELFSRLEEYILNLIDEVKPTVIGSTAYCGTLPSCLFVSRLVKEKFPHIKTVLGGGSFSDQLVEGTPNYDLFLQKTTYLDKIFIGSSEILFLKWLNGELDQNKRVYTLKDIDGEKLDINCDWDIPDLDDMPVKDYLYLAAVGSRSCPYECSFCNVKNFWGSHKRKKVKQTFNEMVYLQKKYGSQLFFLYDSLLNTIISDLSREFISSDSALYYVGYLRACKEACDINNTLQWRRGGFHRARLGFESGSQRVLDIIGKNITPDLIRGTLEGLAYAGIQTTGYFIVGHPGETEEDFQMTLDLIEECKNLFWEVECNPFNYFYSGQQSADDWSSKRTLLYPEYATDWLISQTWTLEIEPKREEVYNRMSRFVQHCDKLGIPNPYTIQEIYKADKRWKKLHPNAVPSVAELRDPDLYINECKKIRNISLIENNFKEVEGFSL